MTKIEKKFQEKLTEYIENENTLKKNIETLQKYSDELEKDRGHERTQRLKLEEEFMQNTKNHEEEV
jgi:hypothetical protein